jgi:hypothetical protein
MTGQPLMSPPEALPLGPMRASSAAHRRAGVWISCTEGERALQNGKLQQPSFVARIADRCGTLPLTLHTEPAGDSAWSTATLQWHHSPRTTRGPTWWSLVACVHRTSEVHIDSCAVQKTTPFAVERSLRAQRERCRTPAPYHEQQHAVNQPRQWAPVCIAAGKNRVQPAA